VIGNAFTALALSGTGLVGAGAVGFSDFNLTFHNYYLLYLLFDNGVSERGVSPSSNILLHLL